MAFMNTPRRKGQGNGTNAFGILVPLSMKVAR
jgi:hypothetical protein